MLVKRKTLTITCMVKLLCFCFCCGRKRTTDLSASDLLHLYQTCQVGKVGVGVAEPRLLS